MKLKELENDYTEFIDYVFSFYGPNGLYPLGVNKGEIKSACLSYMLLLENGKHEGIKWGGGDTVDRERVRELIEEPTKGLAIYTAVIEFYDCDTLTKYNNIYFDEINTLLKNAYNWKGFKSCKVYINNDEGDLLFKEINKIYT